MAQNPSNSSNLEQLTFNGLNPHSIHFLRKEKLLIMDITSISPYDRELNSHIGPYTSFVPARCITAVHHVCVHAVQLTMFNYAGTLDVAR